jgi:hypothetical protein
MTTRKLAKQVEKDLRAEAIERAKGIIRRKLKGVTDAETAAAKANERAAKERAEYDELLEKTVDELGEEKTKYLFGIDHSSLLLDSGTGYSSTFILKS